MGGEFNMVTGYSDENVYSKDNEYLRGLIKELFALLDIECESDNGRVYHPVTFSCSSVLYHKRLADLLDRMKKASGPELIRSD